MAIMSRVANVVLLDEPTTGMDPLARRSLWKIIQERVTGQGHSILLTSHSMEECEALCNRIVLLTQGRVRATGTVQELKQTLGTGYVLKIKTAEGESIGIQEIIAREIPGAKLQEELGSSLTYRINEQSSEQIKLSNLLKLMRTYVEDNKILDYFISQPSLEQMFLRVVTESDENPNP
eukprot:TRINITY_DN5277_c0_g1_i2.p1 TRINITY_DN5277_c0_g1~~TRINITY_DN5277_c0_g1_i2.p1  ORF type:complete len:178 (-),score=13.77 TRINITY_DN5277_c0_g1_i2:151-684(-)